MADALGTAGGVVSAVDHRLNQAGQIAAQTSSLAVRTGVMVGPGSTALVTGTSATGTMTYSIAAHHWVTTRGTADGVYLGTKEAATTVATTAAPGANSRIDVIWSKQQDAGSTISADGSTAEQYGVSQGSAAASPTAPSIPVGAVEIARATVATGATSTNGANVTITNTAVQVVARGARIPVRTLAERDALTAYPGLEVYRLDTGTVELCTAAGSPGTWKTTSFTNDPSPVRVRATQTVANGAAPAVGTALIVQAFSVVVPTNGGGDTSVSFPTAFSSGVASVVLTSGDVAAGGLAYAALNGVTTANFGARCFQAGGAVCASVTVRINVMAVGW